MESLMRIGIFRFIWRQRELDAKEHARNAHETQYERKWKKIANDARNEKVISTPHPHRSISESMTLIIRIMMMLSFMCMLHVPMALLLLLVLSSMV